MKNKWAMYGVGALITGFVMENKQPIRTGPGLILKQSPHPCYMFMGAQYIYILLLLFSNLPSDSISPTFFLEFES